MTHRREPIAAVPLCRGGAGVSTGPLSWRKTVDRPSRDGRVEMRSSTATPAHPGPLFAVAMGLVLCGALVPAAAAADPQVLPAAPAAAHAPAAAPPSPR